MEMNFTGAPHPQTPQPPCPVTASPGFLRQWCALFNMKVTLVKGEIETANMLAKGRTHANQRPGKVNQLRSPAEQQELELNGMGAELAYCKAFNLWPDMTIGHRIGGEDCLHAGKTVDVKFTSYIHGDLYVTPDKRDKGVDVYALVTGWMPHYDIVGYATSDEIFRDNNLADTGRGISYVVPRDKLHEYDDTSTGDA